MNPVAVFPLLFNTPCIQDLCILYSFAADTIKEYYDNLNCKDYGVDNSNFINEAKYF